ncbi:MAG: hypothetical protein L3J69_05725 [Desulfobacula sp.]|nr:hypothetical protein [Desulfobacula sp.]
MIKCFRSVVGGSAITLIAMFGYGIGTKGAGGAGVLQTSGIAISCPVGIEQFANIKISLGSAQKLVHILFAKCPVPLGLL